MRGTAAIATALPAAFLLMPAPALAKSDNQVWLTQSVSVKVGRAWRLQQEVTERFSEGDHGLYEIEFNTLLGYRLNKTVTVWAGYTHDPQYSGGTFTAMEHRVREQVTFDNVAKVGSGNLSLRLRGEGRWREGSAGTGWRLRPYAKYALPLGKGSTLVLSSELFFNLNTTAFQDPLGLDRVRNLIAINMPLAKGLNAELGYMNQHAFVHGGADENDNIASVSVSLGL